MTSQPKTPPSLRPADGSVPKSPEKRRSSNEEKQLDEALHNTFPASDPVAISQPVKGMPDKGGP